MVRLRQLLLCCLGAACGAAPPATPGAEQGPYVLVLGTAQDAGLPQIACTGECCRAARSGGARRLVTSLALCDPRTGRRWLLDASPDLALQVERCAGHPAGRLRPADRAPLFDGLFLTHAHMGHYAGLLQLGPEAYGSSGQVVHVSSRMAAFLRDNGPWSLLVERGALVLHALEPGRPVELGEGLSVTPLVVPHRDEFSDTLAFLIRGPRRALLYLPDIDKWERWERAIEDVLAEVDVALVDGTFFDGNELPERDMAQIPHPFIVESLARFAPLEEGERRKIRFTHLNHSNPAADPGSEEAALVRAAGMSVAAEGEIHRL